MELWRQHTRRPSLRHRIARLGPGDPVFSTTIAWELLGAGLLAISALGFATVETPPAIRALQQVLGVPLVGSTALGVADRAHRAGRDRL
jgi:hypothetical protein